MTSFSSVQYTSSETPRAFPQVKKQVHLGKDARSSDVLHFVCMHFLVILSLKTLWAGVQMLKNSSASFLCIQEHIFHLPWFKNVYIWSAFVLCMMFGQLISDLSGKPFNTISMARLKTLQFHLILTPLFTAAHTLFFLSSTIFFHDLW